MSAATGSQGGIDFLSDNSSGLCPEALEALVGERGGRAAAYGHDPATEEATDRFRALFRADVEVSFVATGTGANTLALASLTERWSRILCEQYAHLALDESTAPELLTGARVVTVPADGRKLTPEAIEERDASLPRGVHHPVPGAVTVSNVTEHGEVYSGEELAALATTAHRLGYRVHVDGARFANAVAALGCHPHDLATATGIDALSFGGTKNGMAFGEAIVLFPGAAQRTAAERLPYLRKASGHLLSKHRYVSAPFAAVLEDGAWLRHAAHANAMAARLADGFSDAGLPPRFPTDANLVFVALPDHVRTGLSERGWRFHPTGHPDWGLARFVTSFDTDPDRVDQLLQDAVAVA